ncbi:MAG: inositol monophosphatase family protein [Acidobacteriota bacterium]|nr:inositol monophosphatase family protein [Acidobacteriota bacterium]MDW3229032.1 inositol monophosphatase family protein [Acidobacteriota bacterium]
MPKRDKYLEVAEQAAIKAGHYLLKGLAEKKKINFKGQVDLVTPFDLKSEEIIFETINRIFPEHDFLAEEAINKNHQSDYCWVVDPLDGTTNFAHGLPFFCISIALIFKSEIIRGVVYDPTRKELFTASQGLGAYLNGQEVRVSQTSELGNSLLATGFPYDIRTSPDNNLNHFSNFALRAQAVRRCGSAALDLCYVACGRFDGYWEMKLKPWDLAAGVLIVKEAGGRVTDFRGQAFEISTGEAVASNDRIHQAMLGILRLGLGK